MNKNFQQNAKKMKTDLLNFTKLLLNLSKIIRSISCKIYS